MTNGSSKDERVIDRRSFVLQSTAAAALATGVGNRAFGALIKESSARRRYAIVGVGIRSLGYQQAMEDSHSQYCELVAFCDTNPGRLALAQQRSAAHGLPMPKAYLADDFATMIRETKPDVVLIMTMDSTHDHYIIRGMELGCDVISEKPMTTDAQKCQAIIDAQKRTGKTCTVTFNYRYSPPRAQVKEILTSGAIGDIRSVDFHWLLNTHHGTDYFRRWHSHKANSGGLMVHKATHHFDLVNWWLGAIPTTVFATGKREFYTPQMARRFGLKGPHERCLTCPESAKCGFYMDLKANDWLRTLYLDNEKFDGYHRDRCVFRPDIDIEDTMNVIVHYDSGASLSYSLNAFTSWEGYAIAFNGTKGRLEHSIVEMTYVSGTSTVQGGIVSGGAKIRIIPLRGAAQDIEVNEGAGSHGGGDNLLYDDLFAHEPADPLMRRADQRSGAYSILTGVAANQSIATGRKMVIADLVHGIGYPDYPAGPTGTESVPMPPYMRF